MLQLIGKDSAYEYRLNLVGGKHILGRVPTADLCVANNSVSRKHALIEVQENSAKFRLTDLGSHNGTLVNGVRVLGEAEVGVGDVLTFGEVELRVVEAGEDTASNLTQLYQGDPETHPKTVLQLDVDEAASRSSLDPAGSTEAFHCLSQLARMPPLPESLDLMLELSLEIISRAIPAQRMAVLLTDESGQEITHTVSFLPEKGKLGAMQMSRTIMAEILDKRQALIIVDARQDPRFLERESVLESGVASAMATPMFDEDKVLGILYVDSKRTSNLYDREQLRLLATFGNILGSRLLNQTLVRERQERRLIDAELQRAALIQRQLLSRALPEIPGYLLSAYQEQCYQVGGDLYDVRRLEDGRFVLLLGDVCGKGMPAALLMSNVLASFRILCRDPNFELLRAVQIVSAQLCEQSEISDFVTIFIALLDPILHTLRFVSAGHYPVLLIRADGDLTELGPTGMMIGAFEGVNWTERELKIGTEDALFVYSDGIPEEQSGGQFYGEQRMADLVTAARHLAPADLVRRVIDDVDSFLGDNPRSDDITLLVLKRLR